MSVSDSLRYGKKPASISGTVHRQSVPSYNGTKFLPQQKIMINIPCGRTAHYLNTRMSYLRFKVTNTHASAGFKLDYSASAFIQNLLLYHGSNLLEQINEYNALYHFLLDMQGSEESVGRAGTILQGSSSSRTGATIAFGESQYFCIPVLSGVVGPLQSKYLPVGAMTGGDLRLELDLAQAATPVVQASGVPSWEISDVELELEYVEVNVDVDRMIRAANPLYVISCESYHNFTSSVPGQAAAQQINTLIPARFSSLKTLYSIFRLSSDLTAAASKSVSCRVYPSLKTWYYSISGHNVPATPVREPVEAFAELLKAFHTFGAADNTCLMNLANYTSTAGVAADSGFAIGQNLETLSHKSTLTESGVNTLNTNCFLLGTLTSTVALQISTWAHHDMLLVIENGVAVRAA